MSDTFSQNFWIFPYIFFGFCIQGLEHSVPDIQNSFTWTFTEVWAFGVSRCDTSHSFSWPPFQGNTVVRGPEWFMAKNSLTFILPKNPETCYLKCSSEINEDAIKGWDIFLRWIFLKNWEMIGEQMAHNLLSCDRLKNLSHKLML